MAPGGANRFTITTPGGSVSKLFSVTSTNTLGLKPVITQLMPKHAAPGAQITIFGHHFSGASLVKLAGMKATFKIPSDSRIVVKVPMKAHSGSWTVKTGYGTAVSGTRFTVTERRLIEAADHPAHLWADAPGDHRGELARIPPGR